MRRSNNTSCTLRASHFFKATLSQPYHTLWRAGALLTKLESVREEMYAFKADNAPSPGESEFSFRSRI